MENLSTKMLEFIDQINTNTLKTMVNVLYTPKSDNLSKISFIEYFKKNKQCVEMDPQSIRYEYIIMGTPYNIDLIIMNNPSQSDMYNHLSLGSLDKFYEIKKPILIITENIPLTILNSSDTVLLFHKINIIN